MGIGMQIVYRGFYGDAQLEAEAATQLVRLTRYNTLLSSCHLAIEEVRSPGAAPTYEVRLDLITPARDLKSIRHFRSEDPKYAIRCAFDAAEAQLRAAQQDYFERRP